MAEAGSLRCTERMQGHTTTCRESVGNHRRTSTRPSTLPPCCAPQNSAGVDRTCSAAATAWYNEVSLYRFTSTPYTSNNWQFRWGRKRGMTEGGGSGASVVVKHIERGRTHVRTHAAKAVQTARTVAGPWMQGSRYSARRADGL